MQRKIRVLVGKPGLDGHDRGAKVVAAALRDAGMEVIYTGLHQTPEQVVEAAVQEDVDVVALSILSGAHMTLFPEVQALMQSRGIGDRLLTGGGIIPPEDMERLAGRGVGRLFGPGSSTADIASYIRAWFVERHGEGALAPPPPPPAQGALFETGVAGDWAMAAPAPAAAPRPGRAAKRPAVKRAAAQRATAKAKRTGAKPKRKAAARAKASPRTRAVAPRSRKKAAPRRKAAARPRAASKPKRAARPKRAAARRSARPARRTRKAARGRR